MGESKLLQTIKDKLRATAAHTNAERRHLKELSQTYEHALREYQDSNDAVKMQAEVEQVKARKRWAQAAGVGIAKAKFLSLLHESKSKHGLTSLTQEIPGRG